MFCRKCGNILTEVEKFCPQCGTPVNAQTEMEHYEKPSRSTGARKEPHHSNTVLILVLLMVICILVLVFLGFMIFDSSNGGTNTANSQTSSSLNEKKANNIKDTVITAKNYKEIYDTLGNKIDNEKEAYYFTYACMYYILQDGLSQEYFATQDESVLYQRIYNKTVQKLINEGKDLMKENNMTVEKWKKQLTEQSK